MLVLVALAPAQRRAGRRARRRSRAACSTSCSARTCRRASPSTRPRPSRPCGRPCRASTTSSSSTRSRSSRAWTPSSASWPRSGPGRTTTATWSSSSARTSSGTTASPSPRRTSSSPSTCCARRPTPQAKLRINPRKDWYANVEAIEAPDPHTVVFHLKRPQPSLLLMLASGYTPGLRRPRAARAATGPAASGTGPFKLKEWRKGEFVEYVKNPDYFVKGRPYLDGLKYIVIVERGTRIAGAAGRPARRRVPRRDDARRRPSSSRRPCPQLVVTPFGQNVSDNIIMNVKKPPFDNRKVRLAVSLRDRPPGPRAGRAPGRAAMLGASHGAEAVRACGALARQGPGRRCPATASRPTTRPRRASSWPSRLSRRRSR